MKVLQMTWCLVETKFLVSLALTTSHSLRLRNASKSGMSEGPLDSDPFLADGKMSSCLEAAV